MGALARNLAAAGFDAARPALFTCEGIFCYLPQVSTRATPFGYACGKVFTCNAYGKLTVEVVSRFGAYEWLRSLAGH